LARIRHAFPWLRHVFADAAYAGEKLETTLAGLGEWTLEIVRRSELAKGFQLLPRRWVVERSIAWLNRNRRLAKDFEASVESALAWVMIASVKLLLGSRARISSNAIGPSSLAIGPIEGSYIACHTP
jgi:transposase